MELAKNKDELLVGMQNCFQFEGMNMLEHGIAVHTAYAALINQLNGEDQIIDLPP